MDRAIKTAEIKRLTLHKLRHTFVSLLLSRGAAIPKVSNLLGHPWAERADALYVETFCEALGWVSD